MNELSCARCGVAVDANLGDVSVCEGCLARFHAGCWSVPCSCGAESAILVEKLAAPARVALAPPVARRSRVPVLVGIAASIALVGAGLSAATRTGENPLPAQASEPVVSELVVEPVNLVSTTNSEPVAKSWAPFFHDDAGLTALAVDWDARPGVVYVGVRGHGVRATTDLGLTWSTAATMDATRVFAYGQSLVASPTGVATSRGNDVSLMVENGVPFCDQPVFGRHSAFYVGTRTGISCSPLDAGTETWFPVSSVDSGKHPSAVAFDCNREGTYGAGPDGVWSLTPATGRLLEGSPTNCVAIASNEHAIWAGTPDAIYARPQGTETWTPVTFPQAGATLIELAAYGGWGRSLWAVTDKGLFKSDDAGMTWRAQTLEGVRWLAIDNHDLRVAYALCDTAVYRTAVGGD
jgi:hypothetical protein